MILVEQGRWPTLKLQRMTVQIAGQRAAQQQEAHCAQIALRDRPLIDMTSVLATGAAVTNWCEDGELTNAFVDWLYSKDASAVLRQ